MRRPPDTQKAARHGDFRECAPTQKHYEDSTTRPYRRNAGRAAGSPLPVRGTCLRLWKRSDVRDALWKVLNTPSAPRTYGIQLQPSGSVSLATITDEIRERLDAAARTQAVARAGCARIDPVLDAWVELLLPFFSDENCCFFTGTYRDAYGYPNGLMKPNNVLRDFKRFLDTHNLSKSAWVVCAEPHQERDIWHCHALLADCPAATRSMLEAAWLASRGWASAHPLHDGGVSYCTKYALKGSDSVMFEWNLS